MSNRGNMNTNFNTGTPRAMDKAMYHDSDNLFADVPDIVDENALQQVIVGLEDELEIAQKTQQWYQINGASIEFLIDNPTDEQCFNLIKDLHEIEDAIHFMIGDIIAFKINHGDKGEFVAELARRTGKSEATYNLYSSLSNRIPPPYRYPSDLVGLTAYKKIADKCGKEDSLYSIEVAIETYKAMNEHGNKPSISDWGYYLDYGQFPAVIIEDRIKPTQFVRDVERVTSKQKPTKDETNTAQDRLAKLEQWIKEQRRILNSYHF